MPLSLNETLASLQPSGVRRFAELAKATPGCVSLTLGEPGEVTAPHIRAQVAQDLDAELTHYPPNAGFDFLRDAIARYMTDRGEAYDAREVIVTCGAAEALFTAPLTMLNPGDEVILPIPSLPIYDSAVRVQHGHVVHLDLFADDFQITRAVLEACVTERTKAIVLTTPNNPTGCVLTGESLDAVAEVAARHGFYVICDDVYERLVYVEGYQTFAQRHPELCEQTVITNSFSKPWAMTGWRLGWLAASSAFMQQAAKVHAYVLSCLPAFTQQAAAQALATSVEPMRERYQARRDLVVRELEKMGLPLVRPEGAFYALPSIAEFGLGSEEFCERAIREAGVALSPGVFFEAEGYARISYSVSDEQLALGLERLAGFVAKLRG